MFLRDSVTFVIDLLLFRCHCPSVDLPVPVLLLFRSGFNQLVYQTESIRRTRNKPDPYPVTLPNV